MAGGFDLELSLTLLVFKSAPSLPVHCSPFYIDMGILTIYLSTPLAADLVRNWYICSPPYQMVATLDHGSPQS